MSVPESTKNKVVFSQSEMQTGQVRFPNPEWECCAPEEMGVNRAALAEIESCMREARSNGVLIYKGYLVAEWLFDGSITRRIEVQSVTKSITSMALGVALQQGLIPDLDVKVEKYYPEFEAGPYTDEITFRHLVTCTAGIKAERAVSIYNADKYIKPGIESRYHNGYTLLLARVLTYLFGEDLETVLKKHVLDKIGATMNWRSPAREPAQRVSDGREVQVDVAIPAANGKMVRLVSGCDWSEWTARDLARVGWLYANGGKWNGEQVLPAEYVTQSMSPVPEPVKEYRSEARYKATNTDGLPYDPQRDRPGLTYGYSWWGSRQTVDGKAEWKWNMGGNYGQTCMVWPEKELVLIKINTPRQPPFIGAPKLWPFLIESV